MCAAPIYVLASHPRQNTDEVRRLGAPSASAAPNRRHGLKGTADHWRPSRYAARRKRVAACVKWLGDALAPPTTLRCEPDEKPAEDTGRAVNWDSNAVLVYFAKF